MSKLHNSQPEEYFNNIKSELVRRLRSTIYNEITFSGNYKSCCVGIVDAVNSTNTTAKLVNGKLCKYYSIFLNAMSVIIKEFGGVVVKNVGDSLLYYFPGTSDGCSNSALKDMLECSISMIESNTIINEKMQEEDLPSVNYRVSVDYGNVMIAKSSNSVIDDIFGSTVNLCAKINSKTMSNSIAMGGDLHQIVKNFVGYDFNLIMSYSSGLKLDYPIYSVTRSKTRKWFS
ncbi:MAG: adenylate/guanylate cyclase domain-containing protein [Thaumarchaeota archaeon]|nr:adenylate/guanylate cyclase domain-containing protein [Nitrososphaerota archaeon]MBI3641518.1 adenylate/guanylate cyclase domain-containing protein [Nitrososphaerota archaeon]